MTAATLILDPATIDRVRWRCRRGLLELDIVLGRFIEKYADLNENQRIVFDGLLDLPDTELWEMICGKSQQARNEQQELVTLINAA
jgi:antitoxin CptB